VAATADKFFEKIKQEVAESKAAVEVATGSIDTQAIERERTSRKIKAASILQQFEVEMGIVKPAAATEASASPSVGGRTGERTQGS
jgi:predicted RNA-binding protein with PIN domain